MGSKRFASHEYKSMTKTIRRKITVVGKVGYNTVNTHNPGVTSANAPAPTVRLSPEQSTEQETFDTGDTATISEQAQYLANENVMPWSWDTEGNSAKAQARLNEWAQDKELMAELFAAARAEELERASQATQAEGSFLLNFDLEDSNLRDQYFRLLFWYSAENANAAMIASGGNGGTSGFGFIDTAFSLEGSIARHAQLRDEVHRAFGHDSELLAANLDALDRAFTGVAVDIAQSAVGELESQRSMSQSRGGLRFDFEPNALATHRNFNSDELRENVREMMIQFSQFHTSQMNNGMSSDNAFQASMNFMNSMFSTTTSVNNLSWSDFMFTQTLLSSGSSATTAQGTAASRTRLSHEFINSTQLSPELRALLGR
jgi:hypothetical protein